MCCPEGYNNKVIEVPPFHAICMLYICTTVAYRQISDTLLFLADRQTPSIPPHFFKMNMYYTVPYGPLSYS
jgi:hypothetical protein